MCEITNAIKGHAFVVEVFIRQQDRCTTQKQRMPIRRTARHGFAGDVPASAGAVINNHSLAKQRPHPFRDKARGDIGGTCGRERHHQAQGPGGKALSACNSRRGKSCDQRGAAGDVDHANLPSLFCWFAVQFNHNAFLPRQRRIAAHHFRIMPWHDVLRAWRKRAELVKTFQHFTDMKRRGEGPACFHVFVEMRDI